MNKLALAAAALLAGACATTDGGNGNGARVSAPAGAQYCWQDRLTSAAGNHQCNWSSSFRDACENTQLTSLPAARYSAPARTRMCANGQWLVEVAPKG